MAWRMFLTEPAGLSRLSLRRFESAKGPGHYHDASAVIAEQTTEPEIHRIGNAGFENDPRWPAKCAGCGQAFADGDLWQVNYESLHKGAPDGRLYVLREQPPGAVWRADWLEDAHDRRYSAPDGRAWIVMLPGQTEFIIYGPSSDDPPKRWEVTGELPLINVLPSINHKGVYHGFIGLPQAPAPGVITDDCEGRKFPEWPGTA